MEAVTRNHTSEADNSDLIVAKTVAMIVLGLVSFVVGIIPVKLTKLINVKSVDGDQNLIVSLLLCFGGGVLLFTTFVHLQPEVREGFQKLEDNQVLSDTFHDMPVSELIFCLGFFFVYLVEEVVHVYLHRKSHNEALHRSLSVRKCSKQSEVSIPRVTLTKFDDGNISAMSNSSKELFDSQTTVNIEKHGHSHHSLPESIRNSFGGLLAVLALSFHAIFEGLAVGLETSVDKVWYLFAAIATHKFVIAFCVGTELATTQIRLLLLMIYIGTFAVVTPIGIGAGIIVSEGAGAAGEDIVSVVLQGMAGGTLLYVVFFEVLARERGNKHSGIFQLLAILAGYLCMLCLKVIFGHGHSHGNGHNHLHHDAGHYLETTTLHDHTHLD